PSAARAPGEGRVLYDGRQPQREPRQPPVGRAERIGHRRQGLGAVLAPPPAGAGELVPIMKRIVANFSLFLILLFLRPPAFAGAAPSKAEDAVVSIVQSNGMGI